MSRPPEHPSKAPLAYADAPVLDRALALALEGADFETPRSPRAAAQLRARMDAWAAGLVARLADADLAVVAVASEPGDALRVDFVTPPPSAPPDAATSLMLGIDATGVRAGLELPASRARAARVRLSDPARALELSTALAELPEQFSMGAAIAGGEASVVAAQGGTADDVRGLLDRVEGGAPGTLWIGWRVPRDVALEHAALLDEQLQDALVALVQVFALLGGDGAPAPADADASRGGPRRKHAVKDHARSRPRDEDRDRSAVHKRGRADRERPAKRDRDREPAGSPSPAGAVGPSRARATEPEAPAAAAPRRRGLAELKTPPRPGLRPRPAVDSSTVVEKGARVEVLRGAFSGKVGVVQELDGKGGARVMLGLLAVRVDVANLVPSQAGRTRPLLSTSHRKPLSVRS